MTAVQVLAIIVGIAAAVALTNALNPYMFWILALIGGIAGGVIVYALITKYLPQLMK